MAGTSFRPFIRRCGILGTAMDPTATSIRVRSAMGGDRDAVAWLVERLSPVLLAQARWRLRGRAQALADAEDVVAHAWQVALPRLPELVARDGRFGPVLVRFLASIVLRRVNELLRAAARRVVAMGGSAQVDGVAAREPGVVTHAIQREHGELAQRALAAVDEADRDVIVLRLLEQRPAAEVGAMLGLTANAVHVRLHRALARLRAALPASAFTDLAAETAD